MEKKLGKSVVATGIAATTIISGSLTHQVKADDLSKESKKEPKTTEVTEKPVTEADLEVSKVHLDAANVQVKEQTKATEEAQKEVDEAKAAKEQAEEQVAQAQALQAEATAENMDKAESDIKAAQEEVAQKEADVQTAKEAEEAAQADVKEQENKVAGQQSLVDMAQKEVNEAKAPIAREEAELAEAQKQESQAQENLAAKEGQLEQAQATSDQSAAQKDLEAKVAQADKDLNQTKESLAAKQAQVSELEKSQPASSVTFANGNYQGFLESAKNNGATQAIREAANKALETYANASREGVNVDTGASSAATLENNLKALEMVKAINAHRRQAGLHELYVDPYANVQSQIQALLFEAKGWHDAKYFANENVAISFTPQGAVDFWHREKALYQQVAAQHGLPTDERQLDANDIYSKVGAATFAKIGHYVQMMDNKATAISAAYNNHPNQFSQTNGTAEVGFHNIRNLAERINNGTLMTVADFENLLRNGAAGAVNPALTNLKNELAALNVQKTNQEVSLNILNHQLADLKANIQNQAQNLSNARQAVADAKNTLALAQQNLAAKQNQLNLAKDKISASLAPKEEALKASQDKLKQEKDRLAQLVSIHETAQAKLDKAQADLDGAKAVLAAAKDKLLSLTNAPQTLALAQENLKTAQENLAEKEALLKEEQIQLSIYQTVFSKLDGQYKDLEAKLNDRAALAAAPQSLGQGAAQGDPNQAGFVQTENQNLKAQAEQLALAKGGTYQGQAMVNPEVTAKQLPATGSQASQLGLAGMALGLLGLAAGKRRRQD
ncbi:CAP domain-containing protein [Streptococcus oricebi]|nr:CAP domain-containing protein [Streptococcus oricebi]